jgi:uncharacterized lipoprotein YajG
MRTSGFLLMAILLLCGCSQQDQSSEEQAGIAAKEYYDRLLAGDIDGFLKGKADMDSVPADYRSQMYAACEQYKKELDETHGGVAAITVSNARTDSTQQMMQAFLLLNFKDSTKEEIIVPMVQRGEVWMLR